MLFPDSLVDIIRNKILKHSPCFSDHKLLTLSLLSEYGRNLFVKSAWVNQVMGQNISVEGWSFKSTVWIECQGLAQNFQGLINSPS